MKQPIYLYFGNLLDYPGPDLSEQIQGCRDLLAADHPEEAKRLDTFLAAVQATPMGNLEEIYTGTFDMNPTCYIFVGYMLFGESFKRGKFLVKLQELYREHGFDPGVELADHLPVMLRFLAELDTDDPLGHELIVNGFVPVLEAMTSSLKEDTLNPYAQVLWACRAVFETAKANIAELPEIIVPGAVLTPAAQDAMADGGG